MADQSVNYINQYQDIQDIKNSVNSLKEGFNNITDNKSVRIIVNSQDNYFNELLILGKNSYSELSDINRVLKSTSRNIMTFYRVIAERSSILSMSENERVQYVSSLNESISRLSDQMQDVVESAKRTANASEEQAQRSARTEPSQNESSDNSGISTALVSSIVVALERALSFVVDRTFNEFDSMYNSRNDIMYKYGLTDPRQADEIYKNRFRHQVDPWIRNGWSASDQRRRRTGYQTTALQEGYSLHQMSQDTVDLMMKWEYRLPGIIKSSDELFRVVKNGFIDSNDILDSIMARVEDDSKKLMVTPELLQKTTNSYAKFLKQVTATNSGFTDSINNLIDTVAKLEDKQIDSAGVLSEITNFSRMSITNAADSDMYVRLMQLGLNPLDIWNTGWSDPGQATQRYTDAIKGFFQSVLGTTDISSLNSNQRIDYLQMIDMLKLDVETVNDILMGTQSTLGDQKQTDQELIDSLNQKFYEEDEYLRLWSYVTEPQKLQDTISLGLLNSGLAETIYDGWTNITKGLFDIRKLVSAIPLAIAGRGVLNLLTGAGSGAGLLARLGIGASAGGVASGALSAGVSSSGALLPSYLTEAEMLIESGPGLLGYLPLLAGLGIGAFDTVRGVSNYNNLLGNKASFSGAWSTGVGSFLGGRGRGWSKDSLGSNVLNSVSNTAKGALIGSIAGPIGTAIGGILGLAFSAIGGETIADALMSSESYKDKYEARLRSSVYADRDELVKLYEMQVSTSNIQYETYDRLIQASEQIGSTGKSLVTALNDNKTIISSNLKKYGFSDDVINNVVDLYQSNGDLDKALQDTGLNLKISSDAVKENTQGLSFTEDALVGDDKTLDRLEQWNESISKNTEALTENSIGLGVGTYENEYGGNSVAVKMSDTQLSHMRNVISNIGSNPIVSSPISGMSGISDIINNYDSYEPYIQKQAEFELSRIAQFSGEGANHIFTDDEYKTAYTRALFAIAGGAGSSNEYAQQAAKELGTRWIDSPMGMILSGAHGLAPTDSWYGPDIPSITESFYDKLNANGVWNLSGTPEQWTLDPDMSLSDFVDDNGNILGVEKVLPVAGDESRKLVLLSGNRAITVDSNVPAVFNNPAMMNTSVGKAIMQLRPHKSGLSNVPYDNYPALLHADERVLTAKENQMYNDYVARSVKLMSTFDEGINVNLNTTELVGVLKDILTAVKKGFEDIENRAVVGEIANTAIVTASQNTIANYAM